MLAFPQKLGGWAEIKEGPRPKPPITKLTQSFRRVNQVLAEFERKFRHSRHKIKEPPGSNL